MTCFGIPIIAKFENCENIEQVQEALSKKYSKISMSELFNQFPTLEKGLLKDLESEERLA